MNSVKSQKEFKRQIMTSVKIRHHPQLVTLIGVCQHQKYLYIINQYCNGVRLIIIQSTLFDLLHEENDPIPWNTRISMAKQIAKGMVFLHTNYPPIIHRDLKSLKQLLLYSAFFQSTNMMSIILIQLRSKQLISDYQETTPQPI